MRSPILSNLGWYSVKNTKVDHMLRLIPMYPMMWKQCERLGSSDEPTENYHLNMQLSLPLQSIAILTFKSLFCRLANSFTVLVLSNCQSIVLIHGRHLLLVENALKAYCSLLHIVEHLAAKETCFPQVLVETGNNAKGSEYWIYI